MTGELYNDFPAEHSSGDFLTDEHRRVLGALSHPIAVDGLVDYLARNDQPNTSKARTLTGALEILEDLQAHSLVTNLGDFLPLGGQTPKATGIQVARDIVNAVADDDQVPTLHEEKAANYIDRASRDGIHPLPARTNSGDLWYWTNLGQAKLQAPIPNEPPPMTGARLDAALEQNERIAATTSKQVKAARAEAAQKLRERADQLESGEDA